MGIVHEIGAGVDGRVFLKDIWQAGELRMDVVLSIDVELIRFKFVLVLSKMRSQKIPLIKETLPRFSAFSLLLWIFHTVS